MHFITVTDKIKNSSHFTKIFCKYKNILKCVPIGRTVAVTNLWCRDKNQSCFTRHPPSAGDDSRQGQWPEKSETKLCSIIHRYSTSLSRINFPVFVCIQVVWTTVFHWWLLCEQVSLHYICSLCHFLPQFSGHCCKVVAVKKTFVSSYWTVVSLTRSVLYLCHEC